MKNADKSSHVVRMIIILSAACTCIGGCGDNGTDSGSGGPAGLLYVLNQGDASIYIYDTESLARVDSIATGVKKPHYLEFAPDGDQFYVTTLEATGQIGKFDASDNHLIDSVTAQPAVQPTAIAITPNGQFGYVCNFSLPDQRTQIHKYDLLAMTYEGAMQAGSLTHDIKGTSDGRMLVACNMNSDDLTIVYPDEDSVAFIGIDPDSAYSISSHPKYGPHGIVIDHRDSLAYVACMMGRQVRVLDLYSRQITDSVAIPIHHTQGHLTGPTLLAISPDDRTVYLTTSGGNSFVAFDTQTRAIVADILFATPFPFGIAISDDGSRVYVACVGSPADHGRVYVINTKSLAKTDSLDVGKESFGVAWRSHD